MSITKKTVSASAHLPYGAYKRALELATAYEGTIGRTADNFFTVTFAKAKTAKEFAEKWTADYAEAHAAYVPKPTEPKAPKSPKTPKVTVGKGNSWKKKIDKFAGKGASANSKVSHILKDLGFTGTYGSPEWDYWMSIR